MISSLSRHLLPRTTTVALFQCTRPVTVTSTGLYSQPTFLSRAFSSNDEPGKGKTLTREIIADILRAEYGIKMAESKRIMNTVFDTITESVAKGETVSLTRFGKFIPVDVPEREYNNPRDHS